MVHAVSTAYDPNLKQLSEHQALNSLLEILHNWAGRQILSPG